MGDGRKAEGTYTEIRPWRGGMKGEKVVRVRACVHVAQKEEKIKKGWRTTHTHKHNIRRGSGSGGPGAD